jgi:hypothetical protein
VDPVPDPLLLRKSGSAGTSGSVARNSDHSTTEAVSVRGIGTKIELKLKSPLFILGQN